jgi:CTP:phosphocholine cytidylyltransferase-like protein
MLTSPRIIKNLSIWKNNRGPYDHSHYSRRRRICTDGRTQNAHAVGQKHRTANVISTFQAADVRDILLVTGGARERVERLVGKTVQTIYNEDYKKSGMLSSIQLGLEGKNA